MESSSETFYVGSRDSKDAREIEKLENRVITLESQKKETDELIYDLSKHISVLKNELSHNNKFIDDYNDLMLAHQSYISEIDISNERIENLREENDKLIQEQSMYKIDIQNNQKQLKEQSEAAINKLNFFEKLAEQKTLELEHVTKAFFQTSDNSDYVSANLHHIQRDNWQLKKEIEDLRRTISKQSEDLASAHIRLKTFEKIQEDLTAELEHKTDIICNLTEEKSRLQIDNEELSGDIQTLQKNHNMSEVALKRNILYFRRQNDELLADSKEMKEKNEKLQMEIIHMKEESCCLRERIASLEGRESVLAEKFATSQNELATVKDRNLQLSNSDHALFEAKQLNQSLSEHNDVLTSKYHDVDMQYKKTNEQYKELQTTYTQLKNNYNNLIGIVNKYQEALDASRKNQAEQKCREKKFYELFEQQASHIETLVQDREHLVYKIGRMHRDEIILKRQYQSLREKLAESQQRSFPFGHTYTKHSRIFKYGSDPAIHEQDPTIKQIKQITRKLYRSRRLFQSGLSNASEHQQ